jgi:hypothetical protein
MGYAKDSRVDEYFDTLQDGPHSYGNRRGDSSFDR